MVATEVVAILPCNFRADIMQRLPLSLLTPAAWLVALALAGASAEAGKADRSQPMVVEADRSGTVDLLNQALVYSGNVVISQGTMLLRAERVEMHELPDGYRTAHATGEPGKPATWRQSRDGVDEIVEGSADRIEFDSRADTMRFIGNGAVRRLRGGVVADEISGAKIVWDNAAEVFKVEGGASSAVNPRGRVRAVLSPRAAPPGAAGAAAGEGAGASRQQGPAAAGPRADPAAAGQPALLPSRGLGERR
jgi:lipopolysaccharide export system protein LptA